MPTYQYRCASCGHEFDQFQRFADDSLTDCPVCSGEIRRVIHKVGVVFKGSGWYITDSRASNGKNGKSADNGNAAETEKPAAKAVDSEKKPEKPPSEAKVPAAS